MVTTTDTQAIVTHAERRRLLELWAAVGAALLGGGLVGALVAATAIGIDVHTRPFAPYFALGALGLGLTAFIASLTRRSIDELAARIGRQADRNRNAVEATRHEVDRLRLGVEVDVADRIILNRAATLATAATVKDLAEQQTQMAQEMCRMRARLDATLPEQIELLHRLGQRLAVDVGLAYDLGAQSRD